MTDLAINSKPKYGTGQFRQKASSLLDTKTSFTFDKYSNQIKPIIGNDTKGIFKRFANSVSFDSAYPTKLTESQLQGVTHKVRVLIGGDNTVKNGADIEAYNTKALFNHKTLTHGDVSTASEVATTALGVLAGGLGIIKGVRKLPKSSVVNIDKAPKRYPQYNDSLDAKWFNKETGELNWPKNSGFIQEPYRETLKKGKIIDRYSSKVGAKDRGKFLSPEGTTYAERALPYEKSKMKYTQYEVVKDLEVNSGKSMQWFSEKGGGVQYQTDLPVRDLLKNNFLREVK